MLLKFIEGDVEDKEHSYDSVNEDGSGLNTIIEWWTQVKEVLKHE